VVVDRNGIGVREVLAPAVADRAVMIGRTISRRAAANHETWSTALPLLLQRIYAARGVADAADLDLSLERLLPVSSLGGVAEAVEVLLKHYSERSKILIIGDFDADGATSTALVVRQLRRLGFAEVDFIVPNRFQFGYGLTPEIVALANERKPRLIVTVDNGISSHAGVVAARGYGIDVLITDHHLAAATLPEANAIVNPNAPGNPFVSKALAGVGVAFYLMAALTREMRERGLIAQPPPVTDLLDLVALGTVADLVPLDRNNRILVSQGLRRIRAGRCSPGIRALLEASNREIADVVAADLGYQLGPRLNAAGRLDDMSIGIQCLLTDDLASARLSAGRLSALNHERRELEQRMQAEALDAVTDMRAEDPDLPFGLCLFDPGWHQGVVGLVASKIKDRTHRPVIALAQGDATFLKGSARSVSGVHIRDVLDAIAAHHPGLIEKFGGHAMAAGLTLRADRLEEFREAFDAEVRSVLRAEDLAPIVYTDGELSDQEFSVATAIALRAAGPWGQAFPEPLFDGVFDVRDSRVVGERHLKLKVSQSTGLACDAIVFRHFDDEGALQIKQPARVELAYRLDINRYNGEEKLQLVVEHLRLL
jgi:single-stranded-DNA-specific exonuclease